MAYPKGRAKGKEGGREAERATGNNLDSSPITFVSWPSAPPGPGDPMTAHPSTTFLPFRSPSPASHGPRYEVRSPPPRRFYLGGGRDREFRGRKAAM